MLNKGNECKAYKNKAEHRNLCMPFKRHGILKKSKVRHKSLIIRKKKKSPTNVCQVLDNI